MDINDLAKWLVCGLMIAQFHGLWGHGDVYSITWIHKVNVY